MICFVFPWCSGWEYLGQESIGLEHILPEENFDSYFEIEKRNLWPGAETQSLFYFCFVLFSWVFIIQQIIRALGEKGKS